jgi:hypothetical protein
VAATLYQSNPILCWALRADEPSLISAAAFTTLGEVGGSSNSGQVGPMARRPISRRAALGGVVSQEFLGIAPIPVKGAILKFERESESAPRPITGPHLVDPPPK